MKKYIMIWTCSPYEHTKIFICFANTPSEAMRRLIKHQCGESTWNNPLFQMEYEEVPNSLKGLIEFFNIRLCCDLNYIGTTQEVFNWQLDTKR